MRYRIKSYNVGAILHEWADDRTENFQRVLLEDNMKAGLPQSHADKLWALWEALQSKERFEAAKFEFFMVNMKNDGLVVVHSVVPELQ
jgi:hypothetical protein